MKRSILTVVAFMVLSTVIMAQPPQHKRKGENPKGERGMVHKMEQALELTESQITQIKDIRFKSMKSIKSVKNELGEKQARLATLETADNPDRKSIRTIAQEIGDLRSAMFVSRVETKQEIRNILDEQQKMKFDKMGDKHHKGKGHNN